MPDAQPDDQRQTPPETVYKYMTAATACKVLSLRTLRFSSPLKFNDPFDTQWDVVWQLKSKDAVAYRRALSEQALRDPGCWPDEMPVGFRRELHDLHERIMALPEHQRDGEIASQVQEQEPTENAYRELDETMLRLQQRMRLFCVSECDHNILMWSHYALDHTGIVLGFSSQSFGNLNPKRVEYRAAFPELLDHREQARAEVFGLGTNPMEHCVDAAARLLAGMKHVGWSYELEWRYGWTEKEDTSDKFVDLPIPAGSLVEITAGCRTNVELFRRYHELASGINPNVKCFKMSPHPSEFKLVKEPFDPPSPA